MASGRRYGLVSGKYRYALLSRSCGTRFRVTKYIAVGSVPALHYAAAKRTVSRPRRSQVSFRTYSSLSRAALTSASCRHPPRPSRPKPDTDARERCGAVGWSQAGAIQSRADSPEAGGDGSDESGCRRIAGMRVRAELPYLLRSDVRKARDRTRRAGARGVLVLEGRCTDSAWPICWNGKPW